MSEAPIEPRKYLFCIRDRRVDEEMEGFENPIKFVVHVVPRQFWKSFHHTDGDGVPYAMMERIERETGWYVAEWREGVLEISHATLKGTILGGFPIHDFKPIPKDVVREGLEGMGMTWSQELFDYVNKS
jgi:hypothetical protein